MSKIFEVRSEARSNGKVHSWGARKSKAEAEVLLDEKLTGDRKEWADRYHIRWWIEEIDTTGMFEIPPAPSPRERFTTKVTVVETAADTWNTLNVDVLNENGRIVTNYPRNHSNMYQTFEPFRQGSRMLALVAPDYTATSVIDLETGDIIASEPPNEMGFCPVGFYVPDWWDVNDGSILPGSTHWDADCEQPKGDFGFVWGCIWGDDSSWKVQYLDLSQVQEGKLLRDERFGYLELATNYQLQSSDFIHVDFYGGKRKVTFSTLVSFDLDSGRRETHEDD